MSKNHTKIIVGERAVYLKPTLEAFEAICDQIGGFEKAYQALRDRNGKTMLQIVAITAGDGDDWRSLAKKFPGGIPRIADLVIPCHEIISTLTNGGEKLTPEQWAQIILEAQRAQEAAGPTKGES